MNSVNSVQSVYNAVLPPSQMVFYRKLKPDYWDFGADLAFNDGVILTGFEELLNIKGSNHKWCIFSSLVFFLPPNKDSSTSPQLARNAMQWLPNQDWREAAFTFNWWQMQPSCQKFIRATCKLLIPTSFIYLTQNMISKKPNIFTLQIVFVLHLWWLSSIYWEWHCCI